MKGRKVRRLLATVLASAMVFTGNINAVYAQNQSVTEENVNAADDYGWDGEKSSWTGSEVGTAAFEKVQGNLNGAIIDAVNGKFKGQGESNGFAQVNIGTIIYMPVKDDKYQNVTVKAYHNKQVNVYEVQTADGVYTPEGEVELAAKENSFICKPVYNEEHSRYEIVIRMTKNDYLYSFSTSEIEVAEGDVADNTAVDFVAAQKDGKAASDINVSGVKIVDFDDALVGSHGIKAGTKTGAIYLNIKDGKKANITVNGCMYSNPDVISSNVGTVSNNVVKDHGKKDSQWTISGVEGLTAIFAGKGTYIHDFSVEYLADTMYSVTVNSNDDTMGTAAASLEESRAGEVVTLTAEPKAGYKLKEWKLDDEGISVTGNTFTMPAKAVTVTAVFEKMEEYNITLTTSGDGEVLADCEKAYEGKEVSLTVTPASNSVFKEWKVKDNAVEITAANKFIMPAKAVEIEAVFEAKTLDNSTVKQGTYDFTAPLIKAGEFNVQGIALAGIDGNNNSHGIMVDSTNSGTMTLSLKDKANVTIYTCRYTAGTSATIESSSGTLVSKTEWDENGAPGLKFVFTGLAAGDAVLTIGASTYIHNVDVEYVKEVGERTQIDVWDFGGLEEADAKYNNLMTPQAIIDSKMVNLGGLFAGGSTAFGDLTVVANSGDRLYTNVDTLSKYNNGTYAFAQTDKYGEEYQPKGAWYSNGTGGPSRRYVTIANVQAGDKIVAYMGISQSGPSEMYFEGQGGAVGQKDTVKAVAGEFQKYEFVADKTGTYKIYENNTGKPMFHRVMRYPYVNVTGTVDFGTYTGSGHTLKFINLTTEKETEAELKGNNFTAHLAPGYKYLAVLSGAKGYGLTTESNKVETTDAQSLTGKDGVKLVVEEKQQYTVAGTVNGFAAGYDLSKFKMSFIPTESGVADKSIATITDGNKFSAILQDGVSYNVEITGVNDYEIKDLTPVKADKDTSNAVIEVVTRKVYPVTGKFFGNDDKAVTALTFENVEDKYSYTATVNAGEYSVSLRDGAYLAKATIDGYKTQTHIVVEGAAVNKDIMFVSTTAKAKIAKVSDIYVGYKGKENNYDTMREAMEACSLMDPQPKSEADRITVHIAPGTYREQIFVTTPYVSFVNDSSKEVLLTWYYGIGYKYFSSDDYFNPERAYDKYEKKIAAKWGTAVYVKNTAKNFKANGITFENSFNRYVTDEEIEDGVECDTLKIERSSLDAKGVQSKASTERATALVIEAPYGEFKDCSFYSSQDTLYTAETAYFKNCFIEGQTDYIFGSGNCVFDTCELSWKGYSANSLGGYVTANRPDSESELGYLFRNCVITANKSALVTVTPGYYGRPWGPLAKVKFVNTKLEDAKLITDEGWFEMSGVKPQDVTFLEYNTTTLTGETVATDKRVKGANAGVMTDAQAAAIDVKKYFADKAGNAWTPSYFVEESGEVKFTVKPFIGDNGDLNTPYPGHTLTVGYSLGEGNDENDVSTIKWYTVKDGKDTLVKVSSAVTDKTYKITSEDVGSYIKVVVIPETISGKTAAEMSCTTEHVVLEGYDDPDNKGGDAVLGDGINVFLAGDSTVKDYTASGITSGGTARNEGSWGEYLQYFLSDKATVVNYANGGRSSRSFINDGSLGKIEEKIGKGDYLFIQFGHNDCADGADYLAERFCPLGDPDANGIYPVTEGKKVATPAELADKKYGSECYTYDCGGTYKWYLLQYIEVAKKAGATPILVTPVARLYYNTDGTIRPHHDNSKTKNDAYVEAVKQLAKEQGVLLIDGYKLTKDCYEKAYKDGNSDAYGVQLMNTGDKTHNNKLGGFVEAALFADAILDLKVADKNITLAYAVKSATRVKGVTTDNKTVVSVDKDGKVEAFDVRDGYVSHTEYWEKNCEAMNAALAERVAVINPEVDPENPTDPDPSNPTNPDPANPIVDKEAEKEIVALEDNSKKLAEEGLLTDKNASGTLVASAAISADGKLVDTTKLELTYSKKKVVKVMPVSTSGSFTVNAGSKITLPGVDAANKSQTYVVKTSDGTVVDTASQKLTNKNFAIKKGVITTKASKKVDKYSFEVSYTVDNTNYSYVVNVINIGFKKEYKSIKLTAKACDDTASTKAVVTLDGDLLKDGENVITSAAWIVGKDTVLVPGKDTEIKNKSGVAYAIVTLSKDGKSVTVKTTGAVDAKNKPATGSVVITAQAFNGKKVKTSIKIVK